jgi:hypothetical protein
MARPRSERVDEVKAKLALRLREGFYRPGDRFLSTRAVATKFNVCYQTAHRLIQELCRDGVLERRAASGTYIPGNKNVCAGVQLIFHPRSRREDSFGARLLGALLARLERERIKWSLDWTESRRVKLAPDLFPVIWESDAAMRACLKQRRSALLLNDQPRPGMESVFIDSVTADDFSGGASAAQLLLQRAGRAGNLAVVGGPAEDIRSRQRVEGFKSVARATVVTSGGWFFEHGYRAAKTVLKKKPKGIFCCNDRVAEAIISFCQQQKVACPPIVGFDDAPIAEKLNLTTIAIPWEELVSGAIAVIRKRMSGDNGTASHQIFMPRPVIRKL